MLSEFWLHIRCINSETYLLTLVRIRILRTYQSLVKQMSFLLFLYQTFQQTRWHYAWLEILLLHILSYVLLGAILLNIKFIVTIKLSLWVKKSINSVIKRQLIIFFAFFRFCNLFLLLSQDFPFYSHALPYRLDLLAHGKLKSYLPLDNITS